MYPWLRVFAGRIIDLQAIPIDSRQYRDARRSLYACADDALCREIQGSISGQPLCSLRRTMHPHLTRLVCLLALIWMVIVVITIIVPVSAPCNRAGTLFYTFLFGLPALTLVSLAFVMRGQRQREIWLRAQFEKLYADIDAMPEERRRRFSHYLYGEDLSPGMVCGCINCRRIFALPDTFDASEEDPECPECHGRFFIAFDSPSARLTEASLAELHDFIFEE